MKSGQSKLLWTCFAATILAITISSSSWVMAGAYGAETQAASNSGVLSPAYLIVTQEGGVVPFGDAGDFGSFLEPPPSSSAPSQPVLPSTGSAGSSSTTGVQAAPDTGTTQIPPPWSPIVPGSPVSSAATTPNGGGYWLTTQAGGVYSFGNASFLGSLSAITHSGIVISMQSTLDGKGYWLATSTGGVYAFGDAGFYGSGVTFQLAKPMVGFVLTSDEKGYWFVASDGGVFAFGDASFFGSTGNLVLNKPIVAMAATSDSNGYWLLASDGGVFSYGDATFYGSAGAVVLTQPVVSIASTSDSKGYWMVSADGGVFNYGDANFSGSASGHVQPGDSVAVVIAVKPFVTQGSAIAQAAVEFALSQVGQPYLYGGTGVGGYDCSGLVMVSFSNAGLSLPRTAQEQYDSTIAIPQGEPLLPGDLLFFGTSTTAISHDGIYMGNGQMVDAPHAGADVRIESYQWSDYLGATRPAP